jgi:hypothetical protein
VRDPVERGIFALKNKIEKLKKEKICRREFPGDEVILNMERAADKRE